MSALAAIHETIKVALRADAQLDALVTGVVNGVPKDQSYPYIWVGSASEKPWHTMGGASVGLGWDDTVTLHILSDYEGDYEALQILKRVVAILNYATLTVTGYTTAIIHYDHVTRVLVEDDPDKIRIRHIQAVFRVRVH